MNLRPYQTHAVEAVRDYWQSGGENPLVSMATGTGKSLVQAALVKSLIADYPNLRVICLVHVRELVEQNAMAMLRAWPGAPIGINSAGLNRRDKRSQILFAGIQSVFRENAYSLGERDLVLIDEAHLLPLKGEGMYRTFLSKLKERTPDLRVAGFTATPYRAGTGRLDQSEGRLFSEIVFDYCIAQAIADGFLCPPVSPGTQTRLDVSGVRSVGGEFVQHELEVRVNDDFITERAVAEMIARGADRKSWIVFACGIDHAKEIRRHLWRQGISADCVFGDTVKRERKQMFDRFKGGQLRVLVNVGVATTGFDAPNVDMIGLLRPTLSPGLYVQMIGRGTRLAPGKVDCLVLDFAGNLERHGPVDQIMPKAPKPKKVKEANAREIISKECPECGSINHIFVRICMDCGYSFRPDDLPKHDVAPDEMRSVISDNLPAWIGVDGIGFYRHDKINSPPSMRVEYLSGVATHQEWVCFEHGGFAKAKASSWWRAMGGELPTPATVVEAMGRTGELFEVQAIQVRQRGKFFDVVSRKTQFKAA